MAVDCLVTLEIILVAGALWLLYLQLISAD